jgi:hypothetical protein
MKKIPKWVIEEVAKEIISHYGWPDMDRTRTYAEMIILDAAMKVEKSGGKITWKRPRRSRKIKGGK